MNVKERIVDAVLKNALLLLLIIGVVVFALFNPGYLTLSNMTVIMKQASLLGLLGIAQCIIMLTGNIDLSVGATIALSTILWSGMIKNTAIPSAVPMLLITISGAGLGCLTGLITTKLNIPPFITTFATNYAYRGIAWLLVGSTIIYNLPQSFRFVGTDDFLGIPITIWFEILIGAAILILLKKTTLGRRIYFTGSNRKAARYSGIHTDRVIITAYMIGNAIAAFTGVLYAARLNAAEASIGASFSLDSVAVCLIGGCAITGGKGGVWGTVIGAIIVTAIKNGMNYVQVSSELQTLVLGLLIIIAVFFNQQVDKIQRK